jgi:ligand-binding sensor domain-containing protein
MCQRMITILFLVCAFCIGGSAYGQKVNYQQFENIYLGAEASVISCFLQDSEGLIWIGSNKGLFSYDGYSTQQHFTYGERNNTRIYCGIIADNTYLYLGTDNGILVYNYRTDKYEQPETDFPTDVRTMALQGDTLWIGSLNGLYTYQLNTKKLASLDSKSNGLPHHTIYSIIRTTDNQIYVGTYNGLCRYIEESGKFENIPLPVNRSVSNLFVNSLLEDTSRQCIWIGMEGSLFQYTPATGLMKPIDAFHNNSSFHFHLPLYRRILGISSYLIPLAMACQPVQSLVPLPYHPGLHAHRLRQFMASGVDAGPFQTGNKVAGIQQLSGALRPGFCHDFTDTGAISQ